MTATPPTRHVPSFRALGLPPGLAVCATCGARITQDEWDRGICPGRPDEGPEACMTICPSCGLEDEAGLVGCSTHGRPECLACAYKHEHPTPYVCHDGDRRDGLGRRIFGRIVGFITGLAVGALAIALAR